MPDDYVVLYIMNHTKLSSPILIIRLLFVALVLSKPLGVCKLPGFGEKDGGAASGKPGEPHRILLTRSADSLGDLRKICGYNEGSSYTFVGKRVSLTSEAIMESVMKMKDKIQDLNFVNVMKVLFTEVNFYRSLCRFLKEFTHEKKNIIPETNQLPNTGALPPTKFTSQAVLEEYGDSSGTEDDEYGVKTNVKVTKEPKKAVTKVEKKPEGSGIMAKIYAFGRKIKNMLPWNRGKNKEEEKAEITETTKVTEAEEVKEEKGVVDVEEVVDAKELNEAKEAEEAKGAEEVKEDVEEEKPSIFRRMYTWVTDKAKSAGKKVVELGVKMLIKVGLHTQVVNLLKRTHLSGFITSVEDVLDSTVKKQLQTDEICFDEKLERLNHFYLNNRGFDPKDTSETSFYTAIPPSIEPIKFIPTIKMSKCSTNKEYMIVSSAKTLIRGLGTLLLSVVT